MSRARHRLLLDQPQRRGAQARVAMARDRRAQMPGHHRVQQRQAHQVGMSLTNFLCEEENVRTHPG
ncbi:hypothetical protein AWV79_27210 [Cupriavidus sp. UYMMa02A]|nr:hypothetical protein AWV79_27210 [Cupriavidus sp. UYMMa02A]